MYPCPEVYIIPVIGHGVGEGDARLQEDLHLAANDCVRARFRD